ncbi:MAG: hypothetical protein RIS48_1412 [Pseudomonadota bacterium]
MTTALYLEDLSPGQRFASASLELDADAIREFAARFDPQPFHLDDEAARSTLFGGLAASGWHTASLTMRRLATGSAPRSRCSRSLRRAPSPTAAWSGS